MKYVEVDIFLSIFRYLESKVLYQEQYISDLDAKTGSSLKLTILNRQGRVWTMVAGGGASVVFTSVHVCCSTVSI